MVRRADSLVSRALLVGCAAYEDPNLPDLPAVRNNVRELAEVLVEPALGGLDRSVCHVFEDLRSDETWKIANLAEQAEDVLIVYYSGHGLLTDDGRLLLALADTKDHYRDHTSLQMDRLHSMIRASPAKIKVLVLDCCYAERALREFNATMGGPEDLMEVDGAYTLCSSGANQTAMAPAGERYTSFSGELIRLLRDGVDNNTDLLSMDTVYHALLRSLLGKGLPKPRQFHRNTASSLALVRNSRYRPAPPSTPPVRRVELRRIVLGTGRDLNARIDALETLAAGAADDPEIEEELALLAANARLPVLMRVRCIHELGLLGKGQSAIEALETIIGQGRGAEALRKLAWFTELLGDDGRWHAAMAERWDSDGDLAASVLAADAGLWGLLVAMMLTEARFSLTTRLKVTEELAGLGHPEQAQAVLRALLRDKRLDQSGHRRVTAALTYLSSV
ncbi:caspase family protein [Amycolatopsis sp. H20-H5]|uniref:caspase family protein n=1 Tax=Amycolatopsis sp. H20-H5 TaxID=3046309 RepID=UPI002DBBB22C|nr:caspase family protein [Amycolatopsis sp. H20-H5]MEC3981627.1 caspase family protein [Amycolatopsis sp. H20-H5]